MDTKLMLVVKLVYEIPDEWDEGETTTSTLDIECPDCKEFYPQHLWKAIDVDCESCGGHPVMLCPKKEHSFDPYGGGIKELETRDHVVEQP